MHHPGVKGALMIEGGRFVSYGNDGTLRLWDHWTHTQLGPAMKHNDWVSGALPTGPGRVLSWSLDGSLRLWNIDWPDGSLLEVACELLPDHELEQISARYEIELAVPICQDDIAMVRPDWSVLIPTQRGGADGR